jgi:menaquinone-dependent protoporphyrinogen oxidase
VVFYASVEGHTARIAERIALRLRERGVSVNVRTGDTAPEEWARYDGVIVGASVHYGRHPARLAKQLPRDPAQRTAFFSVSLTANPQYAERFLRQAAWRPHLTATFAGALRYSRYGLFKRWVVRLFAAMGGHDTDTSRDYEYTDWGAVDAFASAFAERLSP